MLTPQIEKIILNGPYSSAWVEDETLECYIRYTERYLASHDQRSSSLDIANITVQEHLRSQGVFKGFVQLVNGICSKHGIQFMYVESVLEPRLADHLRRNGWIERATGDLSSFYKEVSNDSSFAAND